LVGVVGTVVSYLVAIGNLDGALGLAEPLVKELRKQRPPSPLNLSLEQSPTNFFEHALADFVDINNLVGGLKSLADIYFDLRRFDEAEESIRESLQLRELISSSPSEFARIATLQSLAAILTKCLTSAPLGQI
jgi:hypothetical protein